MKFNKNYMSIFTRGIHQLWTQYHFLVPISKWKEYYSLFVSRMSNTTVNTIFYPNNQSDYLKWVEKNEKYETEIKLLYNPMFSVIIPIYNISEKYLSECLDSILNQTYKNFEICLADDKSNLIETLETLKKYENKYSNIKVIHRSINGNISAASNSALSIATGEFVILMDDDDIIPKQTMYKIAKALNTDRKIDFVYTDEDKISESGERCLPHFKSDWAPDSLMGTNYISHLTVIRKSILENTGGFNSEVNGAQDYDIEWKAIEKCRRIYHIPEILYHWRMVKGSTAVALRNKEYALNGGKKVLEDKLARDNINGVVNKAGDRAYYQVTYQYSNNPNVEVFIFNYNDNNDILECIDSLYKFTDYNKLTINILAKESYSLNSLEHTYNVITDIDHLVIDNSDNTLYLFLDAHTRFSNKNWLSILIGQALQKHVGFCGPKIIDQNNLVRHYGIVGGINDCFDYMYDGTNKYEIGYFGNLIGTTDVLSISPDCLLISGVKLYKVKPTISKLDIHSCMLDLNLQLIELGYYNVLLPHSVANTTYNQKQACINIMNGDYLQKKWKKYIDHDPFYNTNFSKVKAFYLDR